MNPKQFHYVFIAGLAIFCIVGSVVGYGFYLGVARASDNLVVANNSDDQLQNRIIALQKLSNAVQTLNEPLQALDAAIPKDRDIPGLVTNLEAAADATGVTITDLDFSASAVPTPTAAPTAGAKPVATGTAPATTAGTPPTTPAVKPSGPTPIPFKMEVTGSYSQMTAFTDRLIHSPRYVDLSQFSLIKPHKEADALDITFQANAYVQR